ncbi:agmatinase [Afifella marina]|uniref:Agmatinase n=1 Tax=Afifella marina DSM 2698 TaxID=1120955 RepID=A0A1G5N2J1_AFIMA|nr:agmatinase [Afifella marina]MBK1622355.1 agmatinase [Afifella marina DSM 2698]MBK1626931.1 agmatinase [Afifella marina]MBK5919139.1 agmatinase [Afifella marina]RAI20137.1 agmatinase [Afifella marina DSM 2698]SCZ31647.1 agmatinase [Afifella marina DSM 2698]
MSEKPAIDHAFRATELKGGAADPTYAGALSFMRRKYSRDLTNVDVAILGIPLDVTVTNRPGARFGPQAIRRASAIFDGDPQYPWGIDIFENLAVVDYGDVDLPLHHPEKLTAAIEAEIETILSAGAHLFTLGGDHYSTWPLLKAHARRHGPLALVQFDAHQDTWDDDGSKLSHGSFVLRAVREGIIDPEKSIQIGIRTHAPETCGIEIISAYDWQRMHADETAERIAERVGDHPAYLTFDIDCLDPAFAPGTGTPVSGGPSSAQALMTLAGLRGVNFVGGDVVEVSPPYDHADITAIAASTVAQHYLGLLALKRAGR